MKRLAERTRESWAEKRRSLESNIDEVHPVTRLNHLYLQMLFAFNPYITGAASSIRWKKEKLRHGGLTALLKAV